MPITQHRNRIMYQTGTTRPMDAPTTGRRSLYQELHPEVFANIPSSKPVKPPVAAKKAKRPQPQPKPSIQTADPKRRRGRVNVSAIKAFLCNGDATVPEIAAATGIHADAIRRRLYDGIDGIERRAEMVTPEKGAPRPLYGLAKDETTVNK